MRAGYRDYNGGDQLDGVNLRAALGAQYFATEEQRLSARMLFEYDGAKDRSERSYEFGAEVRFSQLYDSGFSLADRRWRLDATARVTGRLFDEPGVADPSRRREDIDLRLGLCHVAPITGGLSIVSRIDYELRRSNVNNGDLDGLTVSFGGRYEF